MKNNSERRHCQPNKSMLINKKLKILIISRYLQYIIDVYLLLVIKKSDLAPGIRWSCKFFFGLKLLLANYKESNKIIFEHMDCG